MKEHNIQELKFFKDFKNGNEKAFEYFFNKYYDRILGFCIQFIYDKPESKGITQEAFLNLWEKRSQIKKLNGLESFLYTFAKSKCLNVIRHNKVKERYKSKSLNQQERAIDYQILDSMQFDSFSLKELETVIAKSIEELPEKTRIVFVKKRYDNKKNQEIASELNISLKTVEGHMTTALKILKVKLSEFLPIF